MQFTLHRVRHDHGSLARQVPRLRRVRHARRGADGPGDSRRSRPTVDGAPRTPERLGDVRVEEAARISTGVPELDRVLGGGLVPASLVLVGGEPGVGKSTLLLSALGAVARGGRRALLVTGEESVAQVKLRADRLGGADDVEILAETELESVCATLEQERPDVCVIDSVQTLYSRGARIGARARSAQVREAAARLLRVAKEQGVATILVGHVTKDGAVAGPRVLEHLVDCVLQFEGDRYHAHRILRAVKNRFGSTNELGVFEMTAAGPRRRPRPVGALRPHAGRRGRRRRRVRARGNAADPARDPGARLAHRPRDAAAGRDGRRPEAARDDRRRARHATPACRSARPTCSSTSPGGVRIDEPGADLAVALAIASAARGAPVARRASRRSARSGSRAGCGRPLRPSVGSRSARSSGIAGRDRARRDDASRGGRAARRRAPRRSGRRSRLRSSRASRGPRGGAREHVRPSARRTRSACISAEFRADCFG